MVVPAECFRAFWSNPPAAVFDPFDKADTIKSVDAAQRFHPIGLTIAELPFHSDGQRGAGDGGVFSDVAKNGGERDML